MNNTVDESITNEEMSEYLAYKCWEDVIANYKKGIRELDDLPEAFNQPNRILLCGGMVAFDKGLTNFINAWYEKENRLVFLSEVTAQYRRHTKEKVKMPFICTPHLLAKEIIVTNMDIPVSLEVKRLVRSKRYLKDAVKNMIGKYLILGRGYAEVWCYYAYCYIYKLLDILRPSSVVLWNEFGDFHMIFRSICEEKKIPIKYLEFGCLPGTICFEENGQQGESDIARKYKEFNRLSIDDADLCKTYRVLEYLKRTGLNRNIQPNKLLNKEICKKDNRPCIVYIGQSDYEAGMYPYSKKVKNFHTPIFRNTLDSLEYLSRLCIKNNWNLVFKPHPTMEALNHKEYMAVKNVSHVTDANINSIIDCADVVITILSQTAYISLIREKPVVLMGYMQLKGKNCAYEVYKKRKIEATIKQALKYGYTKEQKQKFQEHSCRLLKYYLLDDLTDKEIPFGLGIDSMV